MDEHRGSLGPKANQLKGKKMRTGSPRLLKKTEGGNNKQTRKGKKRHRGINAICRRETSAKKCAHPERKKT